MTSIDKADSLRERCSLSLTALGSKFHRHRRALTRQGNPHQRPLPVRGQPRAGVQVLGGGGSTGSASL